MSDQCSVASTAEGRAQDIPRFLGRAEVARHLGLKGVHSLSRVQLPPPDAQIGPRKGWLPSTVDEWNARRPGRGRWGPR
jgi:hypothetical protein